MKALAFGEILWDVYPEKKYIGGASLNFAAHLAIHGNEVYLLSALGDDALGKEALYEVEKFGCKTDYISILPSKPTGTCQVTLKNGIPSYDLLNGVAYDHINTDGIYGDFDLLYFGTLAIRGDYNLTSLKKLIDNNSFKEIFVDVNIRPPFYSDKTLKFAFENASIIKVSLEELPMVIDSLALPSPSDYKETAKFLIERYKNLGCIVITLGEMGAYALSREKNSEHHTDATPVAVASTVGAGDSFSAAFLHRYASDGIDTALRYAARVAAFVVSQYDAVPDYDPQDLLA